jgi:hypothetical protein
MQDELLYRSEVTVNNSVFLHPSLYDPHLIRQLHGTVQQFKSLSFFNVIGAPMLKLKHICITLDLLLRSSLSDWGLKNGKNFFLYLIRFFSSTACCLVHPQTNTIP